MIAFNSIALLLPGVLFAFLGFVPDDSPFLAVLLFTAIHAFMGANCGGFYKCGTLVSRQYSAFVISNIQFIKCLTLFLAPGLVAIFVSDDSNKFQWRTIFFVLSFTLIVVSSVRENQNSLWENKNDSNKKIKFIVKILLLSNISYVSEFQANAVFFFMATDEPANFTNITRETAKQHKLEKKQLSNSALSAPPNGQ